MRTLLYKALILLAVLMLVFTPPIITGYNELERANFAKDTGYLSDAVDRYERVARLLPWRRDLWEQIAWINARLGNIDRALYWFERAKDHNALTARGWDLWGAVYWTNSRDEEALDVWLSGLDAYPSYYEFYYLISLAQRQLGNYSEQQQALEKWVTVGEKVSPMSHYELGLLLALSNPESSLEQFLLASSLDPEYDSVVETMRTALNLASLELEESNKLVFIGRGLGLVNEWSLAQEAFRQATEADGENAEAWAWLGETEQQLGRDGRAEMDQALEIGSRNPIVRSLNGLYWMRQGDGERALAEYRLAARYDPENPAWQISIGDAQALSGDLQAALESYYQATEIAPTDAVVWLALAAFSAQYNMQVEEVGLAAAQTAVELAGEDPLTLDMLGWTLTLLERYDEAQDALEQALSLDPELAQAHLHLGIVAIQTGNWESAGDYLRQARDLDADSPVGKQAQVLLNQYFP